MNGLIPYIFGFMTLLFSLLPFGMIIRARTQHTTESVMAYLCAMCLSLLTFLTGTWSFISVYLRHVLFYLCLLLLTIRIVKTARQRGNSQKKQISKLIISALFSLLLMIIIVNVLMVNVYPQEAINLNFPLASGNYYVLQGGNSIITNSFHRLMEKRQKYAYDFVKLNAAGNRARGISPTALNRYECYGEIVYSPLSGTVVDAYDSHPDNPIGKWDRIHPEGNYVAIMNQDGVIVLLCHLMEGSVFVKKGEIVNIAQYLGKIGNSGHSSEPHLHISAFYNNDPVPIMFNGSFISINSVIHK